MIEPRIAVDAMGGDHGPSEIVAGALMAARAGYGHIILVGDEARVRPHVKGPGSEHIEVVHADDEVPMDVNAAQALKGADRTSLGIAVNLVKKREADAVVSAGNSGAFLAIALIKLRTIEGIARPAIASVWPALKGPTVVLDSGANMDCKPEWLLQFGIMGSAYAKAVLGIENPRVAVLSVGEERSKGNTQVLEAAALLDAAPVNFIGNVEGKDLFANLADVIVTDGFVGNVALKTSEGILSKLPDAIRNEITSSGLFAMLGAALLGPTLRRFRTRFDYETHAGGPLLGLRGNCIVTHGRVSRNGMHHAIRIAAEEARRDVVGTIAALVAPTLAKEA